jgi:hypothetical protein
MDKWTNIAKAVSEAYGAEAYVAGGAVRDFIKGEPPKDIDVFVNVDEKTLVKKASGLNVDFVVAPLIERYDNCKVLDGTYQGEKVQVIARSFTSLDDLINQFDIGFCQIAWDGEKVVMTAAATKDFGSNTMTVVNDRHGTFERLNRFKGRWPYLEVVNG